MTTSAKPVARPLSPHLQVYRLPLAAILSITHRITGVGLTLGTLVLTCWVTSMALGPDTFEFTQSLLSSWFGVLVMLGFSAALFYHLCNGIRHLVWDAGRSFEISQTKRGNVLVLIGTVVLTALAWLLALSA